MSLRAQLQAIYDEHGKLTPQLVREAARAKSHPLHDRVFDKKPAEAAEAYYLERAHDLIVSVKVTYRVGDREDKVRAFHAVPQADSDQPSYEPVEAVAGNDFTRQLVMNEMEREWRTMRRRYEQFAEFTQMILSDLGAA